MHADCDIHGDGVEVDDERHRRANQTHANGKVSHGFYLMGLFAARRIDVSPWQHLVVYLFLMAVQSLLLQDDELPDPVFVFVPPPHFVPEHHRQHPVEEFKPGAYPWRHVL
jgi:hypothetical protein